MISINDIQAVRAAAAFTRDGHKTGRVGDVYVDDLSGQPAWVTITAGIFGTKTLFAPLEGATLQGDRLVLAYDSGVIAGAPHIADSGHISDVEQQALIDYFTQHQANAPAEQAPAQDAPAPAEQAPTPAAPGVPESSFAGDDTMVAPPGTFTAPDAVGIAVPVAGYTQDAPAYGQPDGAIIDAAGDQVTPVSQTEHWAATDSGAPMVSPYGGRSEEANLADLEQAGGVPGFGEFGTGEAAPVVDATQIDPVALAQDEADHGLAAAESAASDAADSAETVVDATIETDGPFALGEAVVVGENGISEVEFGGPIADAPQGSDAQSSDADGSDAQGSADDAAASGDDQADGPAAEADALGMDVPSTGFEGDVAAGDAPEGSIIDSAGDQVTPVVAASDWATSEDAAPMVSPYGGLSEEANLGIAEGELGASGDGSPEIADATEIDPAQLASDEAAHAENPDDPFSISAPVIAPVAAAAAVGVAVAASDSDDAASESESPAHEIAEAADAGEAEAHDDDQESSEGESVDAAPHVPVSGADAAPAADDNSAQVEHSGQFRMYPGHTRETIYRDADGNILYSVVHSYAEIFDNGGGI